MPDVITVAVFYHRRVSANLGLLGEFVLNFPNRLKLSPSIKVHRVSCEESDSFAASDGISLRTDPMDSYRDYLLIPPLKGTEKLMNHFIDETKFLQRENQKGTTIASSCLGAFLLAETGLLDNKEATTHWHWGAFAKAQYPNVHWNTRSMICDNDSMLTSGGLLSMIDLCFHILSRFYPAEILSQLGKTLLVDSVRQKQSIYAQSLLLPPKKVDLFKSLEKEMDNRISSGLTVYEMADYCNMSLRNFHRSFLDNYGVSPNKYFQLLRIEKARLLLSNPDLTIEDIICQCGINDPGHFRKIFARETGLTPAKYRKSLLVNKLN